MAFVIEVLVDEATDRWDRFPKKFNQKSVAELVLKLLNPKGKARIVEVIEHE